MAAIVRLSTIVAAPPADVWRLLAAVEDWPAWQEEVQSGSGRLLTPSSIEDVEPGRAISLSGGALGVHVRRRMVLVPVQDGTTGVFLEETWSGLPVRLLPALARRCLAGELEELLRDLERAAPAAGS